MQNLERFEIHFKNLKKRKNFKKNTKKRKLEIKINFFFQILTL